jgi:hypothetical protein
MNHALQAFQRRFRLAGQLFDASEDDLVASDSSPSSASRMSGSRSRTVSTKVLVRPNDFAGVIAPRITPAIVA